MTGAEYSDFIEKVAKEVHDIYWTIPDEPSALITPWERETTNERADWCEVVETAINRYREEYQPA